MGGQQLLVQVATYNTNLQLERGLPQDLVDWLAPTLQVAQFLSREPRAPDIVAVGFQELLPLHLGLSGFSGPVIKSRNALILSQIEAHAPNKEKYSLIASVVNVGVALLVYGRDDTVGKAATDVQTQWTGCGPAYMGNKGAVGVRFRVPGEAGDVGEVFTFVCAHLTAHAHKLKQRINDYHHIVGSLLFRPLPGSNTTDPTTMYSTSHLFFFGDLNFRLTGAPPDVIMDPDHLASSIQHLMHEDVLPDLKEYDQLFQERDQKGAIFTGMKEGDFWKFKCSYKYQLGQVDKYDTKRLPAWTDRIMYASHTDSLEHPFDSTITNCLYTSIPSYTTSDHKPVVSVLLLPPPSEPISPSSTPPTIRLPTRYRPQPDPWANVKKYTGRTLDRIIGYAWWLLHLLLPGPAFIGILGFGIWNWLRWKSPDPKPDPLLPPA